MLKNIFVLFEIISIILCLFAIYGKKFKPDILTACLIAFDVVLLLLVNEGYIGTIYTLILYVIIFIYTLLEFDKDIKTALINNVLYLIVVSVFQLMCAVPGLLAANFVQNDTVIGSTVTLLVIVAVIFFREQIHRLSVYIISNKSLSIGVMMICFGAIVMLLVKYKTYKLVTFEIYLTGTIFIALSVVLTIKWQESRLEVEKKQIQLELVQAYDMAFEEMVANIRRQQHDVKNHISAIYSQHYTSCSYEELVKNQRDYCNYLTDSFKYSELLKLENPVLGGFLINKFENTVSKDI